MRIQTAAILSAALCAIAGAADRGRPAEAKAMLAKAAAHYKAAGRTQALADYTSRKPPFASRPSSASIPKGKAGRRRNPPVSRLLNVSRNCFRTAGSATRRATRLWIMFLFCSHSNKSQPQPSRSS